jgi:hypothetical protein
VVGLLAAFLRGCIRALHRAALGLRVLL